MEPRNFHRADVFDTIIECDGRWLFLHVAGYNPLNTMEAIEFYRFVGEAADIHRAGIIDSTGDDHQVSIGADTQFQQLIYSIAMADHRHVLAVIVRIEHDVNSKRLAFKIAWGLCVGHVFAIEPQAGAEWDVVRIGLAQHLEVVQVAEVVARNGLREAP